MKKTINFPIILFVASLGTALVSVIIRIILSIAQLDVKYGVYNHGASLPAVFHIVLAVVLLLLALTAISTAPNRDKDYTLSSNNATMFISCAAAFLLAADLLYTIYSIYMENFSTSYTPIKPSKFDIFEIILCIPSIIFFLTFVFSKTKNLSMRVFFSFFPTAWCTVCLIRIYFDTTSLNTSPNKILGEIALLGAMLYFLNESRFLLGNVSHRFYLASASIAPILLVTSGIPNLLLPAMLSTSKADSTLHCAVEIVFAIFIWVRLASYAVNKPQKPVTFNTEAQQ